MRKLLLLYIGAIVGVVVLGCAYSGSGPASVNINRYLDLSAITSVAPAASEPLKAKQEK